MKDELIIALELKAKGYNYVIQITTNDKNFGEPLFIKSADQAGPLLRSFKQDDHAKIAWSNRVDDYITSLQ
jgi:uncharacterized protein (UPF0297 family)